MSIVLSDAFRPNATVFVVNELGQLLLCERVVHPGSVQTVQGGIDPGELPEEAAGRELEEELGIKSHEYELIACLLETSSYEWTEEIRAKSPEGYIGQRQHMFLALVNSNVVFNLDLHDREFGRVWWGSVEEMIEKSWPPKRPGIELALNGFGLLKSREVNKNSDTTQSRDRVV